MDLISCEYIDKLISISKSYYTYTKKNFNLGWTKYDLQEEAECAKINFEQPFPDIANYSPFKFYSLYGLKDLPKEVLENINGKDIIDAGGYTGDTAVLFAQNFKKSKVFVYEPIIENINTIKNTISAGKFDNIIPVPKGVGDKNERIKFSYNYENMADIVRLDDDYKGENLGLIKSDIEGFEGQLIDGAAGLIKKYKPVLTISCYHSAEDFFELKRRIQAINPEYKFMIRRSDKTYPCVELVLVAY